MVYPSKALVALSVYLLTAGISTVSATRNLRQAPVEEYNYGALLNNSHDFYRSQWVGSLEGQDPPSWRGDAFTTEIGPTKLNWGDITGGVMEGADAGTVKITPSIAWTTSMLAWGMLTFGDGYNKSGTDVLAKGQETLRWNADYLLKTVKDDPASSAASHEPHFYIVYQVGNQTLEKNMWTRPENDTNPRPAYYTSTYNGTSDLAGQLSAAFSATAMVFRGSDPAYSQKLMNMSTLLYEAGKQRRGSYTHGLNYPCATNASSSEDQTSGPQCVPGDELFQGAMVATYNSTSYYDDLTWAAAWLNVATNDSAYLTDAYRWYNQHYASTETDYNDQYISDWNQLIYPSTLILANITGDTTFHYIIQTYFRNWLCTSGSAVEYSPLGRAFSNHDPSLAQGMNSAFMALIYAQMVQASEANLQADKYTNKEYAKRYSCWAQSQARYVLGDVTQSFYTGFGPDAPTHVSDRASSCPKDGQTTCSFLNSYYTPEPNPNIPVGGLVYGAGLGGDNFKDQRSGSNQTWVSHAYNAGLTGVFAGLKQMVSGDRGYDQCLRDYGVASKTIPLNVCPTTAS